MFDKILIANRGEIACRVMATAQRLGVATVAVYSDADAHAKHVRMADEAVRIGPADAANSYLNIAAIIAAAQATGAQAIHPGYGFLSENPDFVTAIESAGLTFIGPSASAIKAMGLKDTAKSRMEQAGVPVVPGYHGPAQDPDTLAAEAETIGYPVLIKARAGGGGKGMRLVEDPAHFSDALAAAQREGQASFGDPACLIEKYITQPRHIEIQVFGDRHGNIVHLFERDCSLQRRHQKVIEEAPAPDMPQAVRDAMGQAAVNAAKAIGYTGAGTVEFIVDGSGPLRTDGFWFMEMNTRLQVEHPVSEAITGLDFVELQLRVAAGEALPVTQQDLSINGWAMEARIYAEDAANSFLPATGTLHHLSWPRAVAFEQGSLRIDSAVDQGDAVTSHYDPMIAKVIVHAKTRAAAAARLASALDACEIAGCVTNTPFLSRLVRHAGFRDGAVDTGLIARDLQSLTSDMQRSEAPSTLAALAALGLLPSADSDPWAHLQGFRTWGQPTHALTLEEAGEARQHHVTLLGHDTFTVNGNDLRLQPAKAGWIVETQGTATQANVITHGREITVFYRGTTRRFHHPDPLALTDVSHGDADVIVAPMPGLVSTLTCAAGDHITKDAPLLIVEAMKMEHSLRAPRDGIVAEVLCAQGDQVADGQTLIRLEARDD
ncbi:acetyl-CoA carboxylase biotin carboxylase subunit [Pseudooctadecabacter jejudonensis]|uniref:Acetyl-/propionyl-coenzyme A carboxylase alpha chain n=1 Tax=Pseudooctadecabacter jejudonensis TaxID=1391910 RepID=A0A1Y5SD38_9RHOB|nr:acetyl/propionyl/methylcrotonyl-CoA carboxylase subunit alpha [Pseudooctadecabacter jejudonensis]SLN34881.1 Acetyl-/propionyl-coenzyme A carboxylase alpha chain [Pseudooctadecabacter jejudonensis]